MPNLKITFSGLCAFVFDKTFKDPKTPPTRATVLMPQLLLPRLLRARPNADPEVLDAHIPQLIFGMRNLAATSPLKPDFTSSTGQCLTLLYSRELRILPDGKAPTSPLSIDNGQPKNLLTKVPEESNSLFWMVGLKDAFPASLGRVNPDLLQQPPSTNGRVIAKIAVDSGQLSTLEVSPFELSFEKPGDPNFRRRIATKLLLEIPITSSAVIAIKDGQGVEKQCQLQANGGDIEVEISNLEIDRFLALPTDIIYPAKGSATDFQIFFEMSAVPIVSPPSLDFVGDLQSLHGGMCPPVVLNT